MAIVALVAAAVGFASLGSELGWLLGIASAHFFLFCNVFRIARPLELAWAGWFVLNAGLWFWAGRLGWERVLLCQLPVSGAVLWLGVRSPDYHGFFADRLNPRLESYLRSLETR